MTVLSTIVGGVTKLAEFAAGTIAAAIATPTVGTIAGAVATIAIIAGACFLIYKGVKYLIGKADDYITNKCNPDDAPTRRFTKMMYDSKKSSTDDIADDIADRVCRSEANSDRRDRSFYDLDDSIDGNRRFRSIDDDLSVRDHSRSRSESRFNIDPLYAYDLIEHISDSNNSIDVYSPKRHKRKNRRKKNSTVKRNKTRKLRVNNMNDISEIRAKLDDLNVKSSGEDYLNNLPWLNGGNITCIC